MINTIILLLFIVATSYGISKLYRRGGSYCKIAKYIAVVILITIVYLILVGPSFRLSSHSAARANAFIEKEHEWLGKIELDDDEVHVFYDSMDDRYRSVLVEEFLIGYRSNISTHYYPHYEDELRTIGGINVLTEERTYCAYMVVNQLSDISSIALVNEDGTTVASTSIGVDNAVTLSYELNRNERRFDFQLVAMDDDGIARYYYGYEHGNNHLSDDEYKWYSY